MKTLFTALVFCVLDSCTPVPGPAEPKADLSACENACARLTELGCADAKPDAEGNSCAKVCQETQDAKLIDLHPEQVALAKSCPVD
jgi:hypothetical protein